MPEFSEKAMEYLRDIFLYSENKPLLFTQLYFWGFFGVVLAIYSIVYRHKALRNGYLFFASLFFYYKTSGFYFFILLFSTITDFFIGKGIYKSKVKPTRSLLLALSVFLNLSVLFYFKYTGFLTDTINNLFGTDFQIINYFSLWSNQAFGTGFTVDRIILPVGISFFTFQTISYSVDVYRGDVKPVNSILDFGFYVSFFPQLVAGPIVRAADFVPQLYKNYRVSKFEFGLALYWILKGLLKKMFISDYISINFVDRVFGSPLSYSGFENLMALYGYSLQVYCDFSGYTDIAIGIALLMGFRLPTNFNSPYKAQSTGEFWKRWHISLSSWLKDYLYIPLGGNRTGGLGTYINLAIILSMVVLLSGWLWLAAIFAGTVLIFWILARMSPQIKKAITTNINIMITMLWGGLWHGSSWMFVIWGGLNGLGVVVYKFWKRKTQYFRIILFIVLNLATFITYQTKVWHNPNGIIVWVALNIVWIISYLVWLLKFNPNKKWSKFTALFIAVIFIAGATFAIANISGLWLSANKIIIWLALIITGIVMYFLLTKISKGRILLLLICLSLLGATGFIVAGITTQSIIIWLVISGVALLSYFLFTVKKSVKNIPYLVYFWGIFLTFHFITFTRIWFRGSSMEITGNILSKIGNDWNINLIPKMIAGYKEVFTVMLLGYVIHWFSVRFKRSYRNWFIKSPVYIKVAICAIVIFILYQVRSTELQPFIYFQF